MTLKKEEKDLKVIAKYLVANDGCSDLFCSSCPKNINYGCTIGEDQNNTGAAKKSKQWAIEYLAQMEKLEFLENLP